MSGYSSSVDRSSRWGRCPFIVSFSVTKGEWGELAVVKVKVNRLYWLLTVITVLRYNVQ